MGAAGGAAVIATRSDETRDSTPNRIVRGCPRCHADLVYDLVTLSYRCSSTGCAYVQTTLHVPPTALVVAPPADSLSFSELVARWQITSTAVAGRLRRAGVQQDLRFPARVRLADVARIESAMAARKRPKSRGDVALPPDVAPEERTDAALPVPSVGPPRTPLPAVAGPTELPRPSALRAALQEIAATTWSPEGTAATRAAWMMRALAGAALESDRAKEEGPCRPSS